MKLISHRLTAVHRLCGIRSLIEGGNLIGPLLSQCSTSTNLFHNASPKAISGRTSYLRVRLAFHRYPQVIRRYCNRGRFGPPWNVTSTSTCSWIGHPVSGLLNATSFVLLKLGFPSPPARNALSLLRKVTRRTIIQKVRYHT